MTSGNTMGVVSKMKCAILFNNFLKGDTPFPFLPMRNVKRYKDKKIP